MEKPLMLSKDMMASNIEAIAALFPNCVTERKDANGKVTQGIDFEKLQQELSNDIIERGEERYQFTWPGKMAAIREANTPTNSALRPCPEEGESVDFWNTKNLYIEGDNLEVLKLLQEDYLGKVRMIYVDPPYNTGNDFVYYDDFSETTTNFTAKAGMFDENGNMLLQKYEKNVESNGKFHTDWLNMMYPRLKVARNLLSDDGVIFISIDDNEVENLRKICDEIFGAGNFVASFIWEQGRKSMAAQVAVNHEYCLVYCKDRAKNITVCNNSEYPFWMSPKKGLDAIYNYYESLKAKYKNDYSAIENGMKKFYKELPDGDPSKDHKHYKCVDEKGLYFPGDIAQGTGNGGRFEILHPVTGKPCKMPAGGWRFGEAKLPMLLKENRIHFGQDESTVPCLKRYLKETEYEVMSSVFYKDGRGASKRLDQLMGVKGIFPFPKDETIIQSFVAAGSPNDDSIVLDFFSGSSTTAHAVMLQNIADEGKRKFIMIQLPEVVEDESFKADNKYNTICDIAKERIRRAGKKVKEEAGAFGQHLDTGFRVLKLADSNMKQVYYTPTDTKLQMERTLFDTASNIKGDRTDLDLLFQVMLEKDVTLDAPIRKEEIMGHDVYFVDDTYLVAAFGEKLPEELIKELAKMQPFNFVMANRGLADDSMADNFEQIFKAYSPDTNCMIL